MQRTLRCLLLVVLCLGTVHADPPTTNYPGLKYDPSSGAFVPATTNGHTIGSSGFSGGTSGHVITASGATTIQDSGTALTSLQTKTGTLALAGFGSITGTLPNANLPYPMYFGVGPVISIGDDTGSQAYINSDGSIYSQGNLTVTELGSVDLLGWNIFNDSEKFAIRSNATGKTWEFNPANLTSARIYVLPDAAGTFMLTSAIGSTVQAYDSDLTLWAATTPPSSYAVGDLLYSSAANTIGKLADVATGSVLISGGVTTAPAWSTTPTFTVTNLTGTASININGTVGATTPAAGTFTTGVFGSTTSLLLGTAGSAVGNIGFRNATSGTVTLAPPTGALGTYSITLPNAASTLPIFGQQITFAGPTAARTVTLPDAAFTVARTDAANTFTGASTATSWVFTTPLLGTPTSGVLTNCTALPAASVVAGSLGTGAYTVTESVGSSALTLTGATQTSSFPVLNATQTWNSSGVTFTGIKLNVTSTAAASASMLLDLQVGSATKFNIVKSGVAYMAGLQTASTIGSGATGGFYADNGGPVVSSSNGYLFSSSTDPQGAVNLRLRRTSDTLLSVDDNSGNYTVSVKALTFIPAGAATTCTGATIGTGSKSNAGFVTATTTGTSTVVVTFPVTAPTGWTIMATNITTGVNMAQSAKSTTTATFTGASTSGDVIQYLSMAY